MNRTSRAHLNVEAHTHAGLSGKNNEDRFSVASFTLDAQQTTPVLFAVLADGIGGHKGGEVAAELAVNHIMETIANSDGRHPQRIMQEAVTLASDAIAARAADDENLKGMGSTCAAAWVIGDKLYIASVGDSRIYLIRGGRIQQLTVDHTWVQEAIEKNILTPEEAREHPNVHVIRRYLGSPMPPQADFRMKLFDDENDERAENNQGARLQPHDVVLLCSDGLTDLVWNDEILEIIRAKNNLKDAANALIELANSRGGHDNITAILLAVPAQFKLNKDQRTNWTTWAIAASLSFLCLVAVVSLLTFGWLRRSATLTATPTVPPPTLTSPPPTSTPIPATLTPTLTVPPPSLTPWPTDVLEATP